jgi:hypothetical protein
MHSWTFSSYYPRSNYTLLRRRRVVLPTHTIQQSSWLIREQTHTHIHLWLIDRFYVILSSVSNSVTMKSTLFFLLLNLLNGYNSSWFTTWFQWNTRTNTIGIETFHDYIIGCRYNSICCDICWTRSNLWSIMSRFFFLCWMVLWLGCRRI